MGKVSKLVGGIAGGAVKTVKGARKLQKGAETLVRKIPESTKAKGRELLDDGKSMIKGCSSYSEQFGKLKGMSQKYASGNETNPGVGEHLKGVFAKGITGQWIGATREALGAAEKVATGAVVMAGSPIGVAKTTLKVGGEILKSPLKAPGVIKQGIKNNFANLRKWNAAGFGDPNAPKEGSGLPDKIKAPTKTEDSAPPPLPEEPTSAEAGEVTGASSNEGIPDAPSKAA